MIGYACFDRCNVGLNLQDFIHEFIGDHDHGLSLAGKGYGYTFSKE
jgi:hypothetical protein